MAVPFAIVGLGEVLWDLFPDGLQYGEAPADFACHVAMLGGDCSVVSQLGDDKLGRAPSPPPLEHEPGNAGERAGHPPGADQVAVAAHERHGSIEAFDRAPGSPATLCAPFFLGHGNAALVQCDFGKPWARSRKVRSTLAREIPG
jgi:hypothetical protein